MSKKPLLLGAVASIIAINSVFADTTVTSRQYVDTEVAKKQNIISTGLVGIDNNSNLLPALVSYDSESDVVGNEYGILSQAVVDSWEYSGPECLSMHCNDVENYDKVIPTAQAVTEALNHAQEFTSQYYQSKMTCAGYPDGVPHLDENCWLWRKN